MSAQYRPDSRGTREFMNSQMVGDAMRSVAADLAAQANAQGKSTYEAVPRTVTAGWRNTERAGAEVRETERSWSDVHRRTLVNVSRQYRMRGGG